MDDFVLSLHSITRWFVLLAGVAATGKALAGWLSDTGWLDLDNRLGLFFMIGVDVQTLLGFILYIFLSPITAAAFSNFSAAMGNDQMRFFAVDHIFLMLVALALLHVGRILTKRATETKQKHKRAALFFGGALLAILLAIPWFRPLLRLG